MYSSAGFQLVSQASLALFDLNIFLHLIKKKKLRRRQTVTVPKRDSTVQVFVEEQFCLS
jgi:hypothetical protein